MVVTSRSTTSETEVMQARTACLLTITVHAPQRAWPQPYFVPVNPISSRINQSNGRSGSPSQFRSCPLIFTLIMIVPRSSLLLHCFYVSESKNAVRSMPRCQRFLYARAQTGFAEKPHYSVWSNRVSVSGTVLLNFVVDFSSVG